MPGHATMTCDEFVDLAAGVALDATHTDDARRVDEHAAVCPECALRLDDLREVAATLGTVVPQVDPPEALRGRLLTAVRNEPRPVPSRPSRFRLRRPHVAPAWLVAAASLMFSLAAVVWVASLQGQIVSLRNDAQIARDRAARYEHVVEVLSSDKLAIRPLQPVVQTQPSRGMIYMDPSTGTGMLMCHNLPPLEQGRAYQVWFVRGNERVSGGLLWPDHYGNGYTLIQVPTDLMSFESIGVTDEPGTGSSWPTTPRIIGTPIRQSD